MSDRPKNLTLQDTLANQTEKRSRRADRGSSEHGLSAFFSWVARICVLFVVCASPWMIASVNPGAQLILATVLLIGLSCWWIDSALAPGRRQVVPYIVLFVLLGMAIGFIQTLELPDGVASIAAGRQLEINEKFLGVSDTGQTSPVKLSLDVEGTWYQLRLLVIALSCLLLGSRYFRAPTHLIFFLGTVLTNGVALTAFGLVQKFRFNGKLFWEIELTQGGLPFGPFVCRNNAAGYLVMCLAAGAGLLLCLMTKRETNGPHQIVSEEMPVWRQVSTYLAMFVAQLDAKRLAVIIGCLFISMGVIATLSRGGVVTLLSAWLGGTVIYNLTRKPKFAGLLMVPIAVLVLGLASWVGFADDLLDRFEKLDTHAETSIDARVDTWRDTLPAALENGWLGTGLGSYRSVHRLYRTNPETAIFEHAENQYVQTAVEAGIPGLLLLVAALVLAFWYVFFLLNRGNSGGTIGAGVFGAFLVVGQSVAAIIDFGWYIPANMVLFATGMGIVGFHAHSLAGRLRSRTWLRFEMPGYLGQALILCTFLLGIFVVYDLYHKTNVDRQYQSVKRKSDIAALSLEQTNEKIERLAPLARKSPSTRALNLLGSLHVHRARLQYLEQLKSGRPIAELSGEALDEMNESLWNLTSLVRIHEYVSTLRKQNEIGVLRTFENKNLYQYDLPQALLYFRASQRIGPLQPSTQLMMGQLASILKPSEETTQELERAVELSPQNAEYKLITSLILLQEGDVESAVPHLRRYLELQPDARDELLSMITGNASRQINPVDNRIIFEEIIGQHPRHLYYFAKDYLGERNPLRKEVLEAADGLLTDISLSDSPNLRLKANINLEAGDWETGILYLENVTRSNPNDRNARFELATILYEHERYKEALEHVSKLILINSRTHKYRVLRDRINSKLDERENSGAFAEPPSGTLRNSFVGNYLKEVAS